MLPRSIASTSASAWRMATASSSLTSLAMASTSRLADPISQQQQQQARLFSNSPALREQQQPPQQPQPTSPPPAASAPPTLSSLPGSVRAPPPHTSGLRSPSTLIRGNQLAAEPHRLHVQSTRNNTLITLTDSDGNKLLTRSGGSVGFKKSARSGYEAGYRAAVEMFRQVEDNAVRWRLSGIDMFWNGFGQGREAVFRALMATEGQGVQTFIRSMTDATRIKIGGVRPKKRRML